MAITTRDPVNTTKLIEKFIGTEFDAMMAIYTNLTALLELKDSVDSFGNRFQGMLDSEPVMRPDGTPLENGDSYFNKGTQSTYYFLDGKWVSGNTFVSTVQVHTVTEDDWVGLDTVVNFDTAISEIVGGNMVFVGAAYQYNQEVDPSGAYTITGYNQITFPGEILQEGEVVVCISGSGISTVQPLISVETAYYVTEQVEQQVIPLPNGLSYTPGASNLQVFYEGHLMVPNLEYVEESSTSIRLLSPVGPGEIFQFIQGALIATSEKPQNDVITLPLTASFYSNNAFLSQNTNKVVITKGGTTTGDGSGSTYVYDGSFPKQEANGITAIDSEVPFASQGLGQGNGCWMMQYEGLIKPEWFNSPYRGVAALRMLKPLAGDQVIIDGFYEDDPLIGSSIFYWDATRSSNDHNGGTVISPAVIALPGTDAWYAPPTSVGMGCWVRQDLGGVTSQTFGADNTGVANADAAFAQMNTLNVPVQVISGIYKISNNYSTAKFFSFGPVSVIGTGMISAKNLLA